MKFQINIYVILFMALKRWHFFVTYIFVTTALPLPLQFRARYNGKELKIIIHRTSINKFNIFRSSIDKM